MNLPVTLEPAGAAGAETAADWYKDAVIYQLHVKAYQDSNGDGIGDFKGLMQRLDHVQDLGATAVWLLPFYPSPLRDDGYDIAEFKAVNPQYGDLDDFRAFVDEAHRRGLKVITELVINHTSDQHDWFQRARRAPAGSPERDYYVWSDTADKWPETRVIFNDTHDSNWSWDAVAGQFYWHRFFSHQPDLNFDNPAVLEAVIDVMHFWLDMGVDGLRLDAIPYLVERDGTNNENLPETHDVLKAIRADLDKHYTGRMLLAEANQWPEDTRPYFGDDDECHMGFHFPLMPRMYMAVAQEDRHAITDIIRQTPAIPDSCQWAIFLRNHDELTLEMVTDRERDYLWETYASDKRARINMGIRRRLAPLMQNDRRKIELLNSLLMSMPGTPVLYYGDEIGMGDNYYLGDRDGVRTPMQWSADRNAGFSRAAPQKLYLPTIQDETHGYHSVNVEAQQASPSSFLNWMKRMVAVRGRHPVFGRGEIELLYPLNRKILAYVRRDDGGDGTGTGEAVLCVANLSRSAQAAELDLGEFAGRVPVELTGQSPFPPVGALPYLLTLPAYGFYWFILTEASEAPRWHMPAVQVLPEFLTLTTRDGRISTALAGREGGDFTRETLPRFLPLQRWFAGKGRSLGPVTLHRLAELDEGRHMLAVAQVDVDGAPQRYLLPLAADWGDDALAIGPRLSATLAKLRRANRVGALIDGAADEAMAQGLLEAMRKGVRLPVDGDAAGDAGGGEIVFAATDRLAGIPDAGAARLLAGEQSNASIAFGDALILKLYRRLREGVQPDIEVARFLTEETDFANAPALLGTLDWVAADGQATTLAAASEYVRNQGDAWAWLTDTLLREIEARDMSDDDSGLTGGAIDLGAVLGRRTAELHRALASGAPGTAFAADPLTGDDVSGWVDGALAEIASAMDHLARALDGLPEAARPVAEAVLARRDAAAARLEGLRAMTPEGSLSRIHGDYHLGQVLIAQNDVVIIDFEGEPSRDLAERVARTSPLRDVAGMLRSFDYAMWAVLHIRVEAGADPQASHAVLADWRDRAAETFLSTYRAVAAGRDPEAEAEAARDAGDGDGTGAAPAPMPAPSDFEAALLDLFLLQKAAYEVEYEMTMRPAWVETPLRGLLAILDR